MHWHCDNAEGVPGRDRDDANHWHGAE
ncbi:MAG: hypothetical protein QOF33_2207, partial [Thermomicrobiales bacterium]|nr:hypothetical protein [Thermomicrobiales bacterium]